MAIILAVSGPSSTGKTSLVNILSTYDSLKGVVFTPDLFNTVWGSLVDDGIFNRYSEIASDPEFISIFLIKIIEYYKGIIEKYKDTDKTVIMDCCWVDILMYGYVNMWANRNIFSVQEKILKDTIELSSTVDRIYLTRYDESLKAPIPKYKSPYKIYSKKTSRGLELSLYSLPLLFNNVKSLRSHTEEAIEDILDDIKELRLII